MNKHIGSSFESWLDRRGLRESVRALTAKKIIVGEITDAMKARGVTKSALARMMGTERMAIHRLLNPEEEGLTLTTIIKAMHVLEIPTLTIVGSAAFTAKPKASKRTAGKKVPQGRKPKLRVRAHRRGATVLSFPAKKHAPADDVEDPPRIAAVGAKRAASFAGGGKRGGAKRSGGKVAAAGRRRGLKR